MANNCYNHVTFSGEKDVLDSIASHFDNYKNFESFVEFGDSFFGVNDNKEQNSEKSSDDVNKYSTTYWNFVMERLNDQLLQVDGESAWVPPTELLRLLSKEYPVEIVGEYEEEGEDFAGRTIYKNGVAEDHQLSYHEWLWIEDRERFMESLDEYSQSYENFDEFKMNSLDGFVTPLTEGELSAIREAFGK
jgi:hypothetical protein